MLKGLSSEKCFIFDLDSVERADFESASIFWYHASFSIYNSLKFVFEFRM